MKNEKAKRAVDQKNDLILCSLKSDNEKSKRNKKQSLVSGEH